MLKKVVFLILSIVICLSLISCSGGGGKSVDIFALADELAASDCFTEDINALDDNAVSVTYILADGVKAKVYMSSGAVVDEVSVFEAPDENTAKTQLENVKQRQSDRIENYKSYMPDEVPKLENAICMQKGKYVVFCATSQPEMAQERIDKYFE